MRASRSWQYIRQFLLQVESARVNLCVNRSTVNSWLEHSRETEKSSSYQKGNENYLKLAGGSSYRDSTVVDLLNICTWNICNLCEVTCEILLLFMITDIYTWKLMWNPRWSVCENMWELVACEILFLLPFNCEFKKAHVSIWNPIWKCMWKCVNLSSMWNSFATQWGFTCESLCETPCEAYVKICVKGLTSFHTLFTYISLYKISHACEICVKYMDK